MFWHKNFEWHAWLNTQICLWEKQCLLKNDAHSRVVGNTTPNKIQWLSNNRMMSIFTIISFVMDYFKMTIYLKLQQQQFCFIVSKQRTSNYKVLKYSNKTTSLSIVQKDNKNQLTNELNGYCTQISKTVPCASIYEKGKKIFESFS